MHNQATRPLKSALLLFRIIFFICAIFFFLLGMLMILFPDLMTRTAGEQDPLILGILRGSGGSVIIYALFYLFIAMKPFARRWAACIIACANLLAIGLDIASVLLGEYAFSNVVIDISVETLSFLTIVTFYSLFKTSQITDTFSEQVK